MKATIEVPKHIRANPDFMASPRFAELRNELYAHLRSGIEKTVGGFVGKAAARDRARRGVDETGVALP